MEKKTKRKIGLGMSFLGTTIVASALATLPRINDVRDRYSEINRQTSPSVQLQELYEVQNRLGVYRNRTGQSVPLEEMTRCVGVGELLENPEVRDMYVDILGKYRVLNDDDALINEHKNRESRWEKSMEKCESEVKRLAGMGLGAFLSGLCLGILGLGYRCENFDRVEDE